jgi:OmpA-OmpF porin, OOP family
VTGSYNKKMKRLLTILLLLLSEVAVGQNLVRNPSLEDFNGSIVGWKIIAATPDIASRDGRMAAKAPFANPLLEANDGPQKLRGIAFGEVCLCQWFNAASGEVTQVELTQPLERKQVYEVSLFVIKSTVVEEAISEVSVALTRRELKLTDKPAPVPFLSLTSAVRPLISSREEWVRVSGVYTAKGGEQYLTIGNFAGANQARLAGLTGFLKGVYYCYDKVEVIPLDKARTTPVPEVVLLPGSVQKGGVSPPGDTLILEDAGFAFDQHALQPASFPMLDELADYLKQHPATGIRITGYTDEVGQEADNQELSEKRARAVAVYLLEKGISKERIKVQGLGELHPKASNETKEGRARNRRVEITLSHPQDIN